MKNNEINYEKEINNDDFSDIDDDFSDDDDDDDFGNYNDDFMGDGGQSPLQKHNDLLKELTNFDPYLRGTFNNWLGLSWSEEKQEFIRNPLAKPVMSFNCATWCTGVQKTYARNNNIITDISKEEYQHMVGDLIDNIWLNLGTRDDFQVWEDGDLLRVANEIQHSAELALMGAGDGKYNKFLGTTISRNESVSTGPVQQQMMGVRPEKLGALGRVRKVLIGE